MIDIGAPRVIVYNGIKLDPPSRPGDCTCFVCAQFRTHHLWARAVAVSFFVPWPFLGAWLAYQNFQDEATGGGSEVIAGLLIVGTMILALAVGMWYQPLRRLWHMRRPRATQWPPPE